jgi:hypothetical protein
MFIRRDNDHRKCTYNLGYCKYWKKCVEIWEIRKFENRKLQILYEKYLEEKRREQKEKEKRKEAVTKNYKKLSGL